MVRFVGAGPGAADLITVRGMQYLKKADVVIYAGSLVHPGLLQYAPENARIFNSALMTLEEVMDVMVSAAEEGLEVVRLHTGEPSLYGAVREQMDILDAHRIPYESCPGVSACFGAAAGMNLEFTLPNVSQTLIITRLAGRTSVPDREKMRLLASHQASMAIYLSAGMLGALSEELCAGGYAPHSPAALVYRATWPDEISVMCTVGTLEETGRRYGIRKTALVLVGDVLHARGEHAAGGKSPEAGTILPAGGEEDTADMPAAVYERSRLYSPDYSTQYRQAKED